MTRLSDDDFRARLQAILRRSGGSMRQLSAAFGRDPGYVAALLDPARPSRARPTPADLVSASDATGIPLVELLEGLWGIDRSRLADELATLGVATSIDRRLEGLSHSEQAVVVQLIDVLTARSADRWRQRSGKPSESSR